MKDDTTIYYGARVPSIEVTVNGHTLDPAPSQAVHNHSPDGFEWGYPGSGPAQLALAICLDFLEGDAERSLRVYQELKRTLIVHLSEHAAGEWKLNGRTVRETIEEIERQAAAPACDVCSTKTAHVGDCYKCLNCGNSMAATSPASSRMNGGGHQ